MQEHGIKSIIHRKFRVSTTDSRHDHRVFENQLDRDFAANALPRSMMRPMVRTQGTWSGFNSWLSCR